MLILDQGAYQRVQSPAKVRFTCGKSSADLAFARVCEDYLKHPPIEHNPTAITERNFSEDRCPNRPNVTYKFLLSVIEIDCLGKSRECFVNIGSA